MEYYPNERHEHNIELSEMMQLPAALADPVCIVVSDTPGCIEVITELKEDNKNVLVAVQLNGLKEGSRTQRVNRIASLYGKDKIEAILTHTRLYWNKAKARIWTGGGRLQLPTAPYPKRAPKHKVLKPEDLVKYKQQNNFSFSMERNLAAVKAVLATVNGRIVDDSSSENKKELTLDGYNTWVYLKWRAENKAWVVTGYKENDKHSSVDDRQRAMNLAESYALNTFGGLERVGASLEYSIARVAREYKQNNANPFLKLDFSASMARVTQRSMELLEARGEEEVAQDIMADMRAACERLSVVLADDDVDALQRQAERDRLQGMTEEEARDALMEIASDKLETAFLKVARDSVRRLDQFLKDRALERIEWLYTHAYPTREDSKTKALVKKNVLVALHVGVTSSTDRKLIVSKIASAYGKNHIRTIINKHKILYWNDQKGKVMLNNYRLQLPQAIQHDLSTGNM